MCVVLVCCIFSHTSTGCNHGSLLLISNIKYKSLLDIPSSTKDKEINTSILIEHQLAIQSDFTAYSLSILQESLDSWIRNDCS